MNRRRFFGVAATAPAAIVAQPAQPIAEMVEADIAPIVPAIHRLPAFVPKHGFVSSNNMTLEEWGRAYLQPQIKALVEAIDADIAKDIEERYAFFVGDRW